MLSPAPALATAGDAITPGHPDYDAARAVFNAMVDRRPAVIVRPHTTEEVAAAIAHARAHDLPLAVRGGGHGVVGFAVCDDGLVIDLSAMRAVDVDPAARVARVQAGAQWGDVDAATQAHGLAVTGGRVSHTGVAGLTLGSGSGWLERKLGYTADNLLAAELVTAEGQLVRASADEHPDLFWALRGGGGNFGVVTAFEFALHPVGPVITAGMLGWPLAVGAPLARHVRDVVAEAPDDLGAGLVAVTIPDFGQALVVIAAWFGDPAGAGPAIDRFRELTPPAIDAVTEMGYVDLQRIIDPMCPPGQRQYWKAHHLPALTDAAIDAWLEVAAGVTSPFTQLVLEPKDGACGRVPADATPLRRDAGYAAMVFSVWDDPAEDARHIAFTREASAALAAHGMPGVTPNYSSDTGAERLRATFGDAAFERLRAVKRRWDPDNVFRLNQNIEP